MNDAEYHRVERERAQRALTTQTHSLGQELAREREKHAAELAMVRVSKTAPPHLGSDH